MLTQGLLDRIAGLLNREATNYTVFLRLYRLPISDEGDDPRACICKILGSNVEVGGIEEVSVEELLAEVDGLLRFTGDSGAGPSGLALKSKEFSELLIELDRNISELASQARRVERFWLKVGHPAYPVFWDFAYLFLQSEAVTILLGSSSD